MDDVRFEAWWRPMSTLHREYWLSLLPDGLLRDSDVLALHRTLIAEVAFAPPGETPGGIADPPLLNMSDALKSFLMGQQ